MVQRILLGIAMSLVTGCSLAPITVTHEHGYREPPVITVVVDTQAMAASVVDVETPSAPSTPAAPPPAVRADDNHKTCPPFELPDVAGQPLIPRIAPEHRGDTDHLANVLISHIKTLMEHHQNVRDEYNDAYRRYLNACESTNQR